jgi:predicted Ser/Thr protein kinase
MTTTQQQLVREGDIVAGKYRVEKVIGEGGMGLVVSAFHMQLEERVALKLLLPEAARSDDVINRFLREARAAVKIKSEHVARVIDVGTLDSGLPYMVMEFLTGRDLAAVLAAQGPLPVEDVIEWILQACEALAEAHAAGIVHRDLKPSNLFLTRRADGSACVKVLDFGISKVSQGREDMGMTRTSTVMGSPLYMSPEQMRSTRDVDQRTDLWALGAIMYELLTGVPPFDAETITQLCVMVLQTTPRPVTATRPDAANIEPIVNHCLEKDTNLRFQNVGELAVALSSISASEKGRISAQRVSQVLRSAGMNVPEMGTLLPGRASAASFGVIPSAMGAQGTVPSGPITVPGGYPPGAITGGNLIPAGSSPSLAMPAPPPHAGARTQASWGATTGSQPQRSRMPLVVGVIAFGALVGGGGSLLFLRGDKEKEKKSAKTETSEVAPAALGTGAPATTLTPQTPTSPPVADAPPVIAPPPLPPTPTSEPATDPAKTEPSKPEPVAVGKKPRPPRSPTPKTRKTRRAPRRCRRLPRRRLLHRRPPPQKKPGTDLFNDRD